MTSRERAEAVVQKINSQRNRIAGGYEIPRDEPGPIDLIAAALEADEKEIERLKKQVEKHNRLRVMWRTEHSKQCEREAKRVGEPYAEQQVKRLRWTTDQPTVAGQYWCRIIGQYEPFTIFVHANDDGEGLGILLAEDDWVSVHDEELSKADWCPVPMPEEGA